MEEEKKEVVEEVKEEEVKEVAPVQQEQVDEPGDVKNALISFILAVAGFVVSASAIVTIVLGAISLGMLKKIKGRVEKKPHAVFMKVAKPVAIVDIILGALVTLGYIIWLIVWLVMLAVAAAAAAEAGAAA